MATELTEMRIGEISLVDEPANEAARVVIVKAKSAKPVETCKGCKTPDACKKAGECADDKEPDSDPDDKMKKRSAAPVEVKMAKVASSILSAITALAPEIVAKAMSDGFSDDKDAAALAEAIIKETVMDIESLTKALEAAEAENAALKKRADTAEAAVEELKKSAPKRQPSEDDIMKSLPEPVRKRIEAAEADAKASKDAIEKMRSEAEVTAAIAKAGTYGVGNAVKLGELMVRVAKGKTTADDVKDFEELLAQIAAITKSSDLFKTLGRTTAPNPNDPEQVLKAKAKELQAAMPELTYEQAYDRVAQANPELYTAYSKSRTRVTPEAE